MSQPVIETRNGVTIGVVVKNSEKTIGKAIRGITKQTYPHELLRVIVVDGMSSDGTLSIVNAMLSNGDIETKILSDKGEGLGAARQIVVDNARTEYLVLVDSDVVIPRGYVADLVGYIEQYPDLAGARATRAILHPQSLTAKLQELSLLIRQTPQNAWDHLGILRLEAVRGVGGYDVGIRGAAEDLDLIARLRKAGRQFSVTNATYYHIAGSWSEIFHNRARAGYGIRYFKHKHEGIIRLWDHAPPIEFIVGLKESKTAYRLTRRKTSFLLPIYYLLISIPWWVGYIRSMLDRYGYSEEQEPSVL
jgi:glycosyltransferase involved in cell wall biosynthesis